MTSVFYKIVLPLKPYIRSLGLLVNPALLLDLQVVAVGQECPLPALAGAPAAFLSEQTILCYGYPGSVTSRRDYNTPGGRAILEVIVEISWYKR